MPIPIAFSPCPNDTFLFHAWVHGLLHSRCEPSLHDIEELNQLALKRRFPLIKVSFGCLPLLLDNYALLPVGAALGHGCGPLIVAREPFDLADLSTKRIAIPGEHTTAHLLLKKLAPEPLEKHFCLYHQIDDLLHAGAVDAGLIIHEQRFTHPFTLIADLGALWEELFDLPIPLGCLVADKTLGHQTVEQLTATLRASLQYAWDNPTASAAYVQTHAQDKDPDVIRQHIDTYVTQETLNLSPNGRKAIDHLAQLCSTS
jgi:5,8-dihydroxy-2-naphthoate synthase